MQYGILDRILEQKKEISGKTGKCPQSTWPEALNPTTYTQAFCFLEKVERCVIPETVQQKGVERSNEI